jgi:hypothetical protein
MPNGSSNCPCPLPPIAEIKRLVEQFNQYETDLKLDAALHELFSPPPGDSRLALCAFALDALWNAGISGPHYRDWPDVYNGFLHRIAHLHWLAQEIRGRPLPVSKRSRKKKRQTRNRIRNPGSSITARSPI